MTPHLAYLLRATPNLEFSGAAKMGTFWHSLRYSLRVLAKSPLFTTVAILSLALGIGALNDVVFALKRQGQVCQHLGLVTFTRESARQIVVVQRIVRVLPDRVIEERVDLFQVAAECHRR